jgi:hypothetical protein
MTPDPRLFRKDGRLRRSFASGNRRSIRRASFAQDIQNMGGVEAPDAAALQQLGYRPLADARGLAGCGRQFPQAGQPWGAKIAFELHGGKVAPRGIDYGQSGRAHVQFWRSDRRVRLAAPARPARFAKATRIWAAARKPRSFRYASLRAACGVPSKNRVRKVQGLFRKNDVK